MFHGRSGNFLEAAVPRAPGLVQPLQSSVSILQPAAEHLLRAFAIADVLQLISHDVIEQIRVFQPLPGLTLDVTFHSFPDMRAFQADDDILFLSAHRVHIADQVSTPSVPSHAMSIGIFLKNLVDRGGIDCPARSPAHGVTLDMLQRGGEESLQPPAGSVE